MINDLSAFDASARTEVDEVAGGADGVFIVFDEEEGVALFSECVKGAEEGSVVAGMKANGGFVEDVEDALEVGAKLRGEADALGLAAGKSGGGAVELEVAESNLVEEVEALHDLGENVAADLEIAPGEFEGLGFLERVLDGECGEVGEGQLAFEKDVAGGFAETGAVAIGADFGVGGIGFGAAFFLVDFSLGFGVESLAVVSAGDDMAVSPAGFTPASWGVEREVAGVEFVEGLTGGG